MISMKFLGITLDGASNMPVLVLQSEEGSDILPIWVGTAEAMAVSMALNDVNPERPLPHTLLLHVIESLGARPIGLSITDLREGTFYAFLELLAGRRLVQVDCRPSDGIVLALRSGVPILLSENVLAKAAAARVDRYSTEAERRPSDSADLLIRKTMACASSEADRPVADHAPSPVGEDQQLAEMLRNLEPATKRVM